MRSKQWILGLIVVVATSPIQAEDNKAPEGFTALFNGKDLTNWQGAVDIKTRGSLAGKPEELAKKQAAADKLAAETWFVKDGEIHHVPKVNDKGQKSGVSLGTVKDYADFELFVDWKIEKAGDSGLYVRGTPQVQIWDSENLAPSLKADANTGSGGLWNNPAGSKGKTPLLKADKPVGEWNTFHIIMKGDLVTIHLNEKLVINEAPLSAYWDKTKPLPSTGPIELQYHGDKLWFKNIYIKELK
jgi:hypothetical protein